MIIRDFRQDDVHDLHEILGDEETMKNCEPAYHFEKTYSKRHNKFLLPVPAKAIYGSFGKTESEISNIVNYRNFWRSFVLQGKVLSPQFSETAIE